MADWHQTIRHGMFTDQPRSTKPLRSVIGGCLLEEDGIADTLAIALCSYFEGHMDRPKDDPETERGWGEWVERKANEAIDRVVAEVERLQLGK